MSRADCDACDEYAAKQAKDLRIYREASEAANRIIEKQTKQIKSLQAALVKERFWKIWREGKHSDVNAATELAEMQLRAALPVEMR